MESYSTNGIRAEEAGRPRTIMLTETNYRVWAAMTEKLLREKKLWGHVTRTANLPAPVRTVTPAVTGAPAAPGRDAVTGAPAITRIMVENDIKANEDFDAAAARASYVIMQTLPQKTITAVMRLPGAAEMWEKLANDYAAVSPSFATLARTTFHGFRILNGESVIETIHRFDNLVSECDIQDIDLTEGDKTAVLLMHPSVKWKNFLDAYATIEPLPTTGTIFRAMKAHEERLNARNESEYEEANYGGNIGGSSSGGSEWKRRSKLEIRRPTEMRTCYCCGEAGHLAKECEFKNDSCDLCKKRGHLSKACRSQSAPKQQGQEETVKEPEPEQERKPKLLWPEKKNRVSFAKGTKRDQAREEEGMVMAEYFPDALSDDPLNEPEWLADSGARSHVCNDLKLLWDVKQLTEPITMRGLCGDVTVNFVGCVKLECWDNMGKPVVLHLYDTLYVSESFTNLLSLQRLRIAKYIISQVWWSASYNCSMILNSKGKTVGRINEDENGRGTVFCRTMLPPSADLDELVGLAVASKNDAIEKESAGLPPNMPRWFGEMMPTPGFSEVEEAAQTGQSWGPFVDKVANGKVEPPIGGAELGAEGLAEGSHTSSEIHDSMPRLERSQDLSSGTLRPSFWNIFDDAADTSSGVEHNPAGE